ncbi:cell wall metabolism sensor histidine kinase WalK [Leptolyngbya sp. FACHB-261]|uniref:sensor histidine kinase n=1 Tax=Leptolyngbya sp. FACHB-261 TaxID=2692806 RepID=UPI00168532C4|nr:ATP-binding protein [Leptolyngbya sp. FACHB-261]MBD2104928.1 PAS domain-containing protein [Leptolyngbya sp. FACHB-261]
MGEAILAAVLAVVPFPSFVYFASGLGLGVLLTWIIQARLHRRLRRLLSIVESTSPPSSTPQPSALFSRLSAAVSLQTEQIYQLQQQLTDNQRLLSEAPIGYLQVDGENRLVYWNVLARKLLGIEHGQEPRLGRLLLEVVRSYELDRLIEIAREQQRSVQAEWTFPPTPPERRPVPVRGLGVHLSEGCVGVYLEDRREAVLIAQQHNRWTSDVAHELKTPLTSVRLVAEMLQSKVDASVRPWLDRLLNETQRLSSLVQDLLELSRLDVQAVRALSIKAVDLPALVRSAWENLTPLSSAKQQRLDYVGPSQLTIQADEPRLYRVLFNLLDNSIQHSENGQPIRISISSALPEGSSSNPETDGSEMITIEVIDWGPGFPEAALPHVFERFYRADAARTHLAPAVAQPSHLGPNGSGLGLAIAQQIVEAHSGTITAANHPQTGGAWLCIRLPRIQAVPQSINVTALP